MSARRPRSVLAACALTLVLALAAAACSSDDAGSDADRSSTTAPSTTSVGADAAYEGRGPDQVGTTRFALADGRPVVAWYPATDAAADAPKETFDIAGLLSPALQAKIPAEKRPQYEIDAHPGAAPATGGPYPLVLFSHGFAAFPEQSADLVTHLTSWGFVVVAPSHVERSLDGLLGTAAQSIPTKLSNEQVLEQALDAAIAEGKRAGSPLNGLIDDGEVAVIGHSAGAGAAYRMAGTDDRIRSFIAYSIGSGGGGQGTPTTEAPAVPDIPGMVMRGTKDGIIPAAASKKVYDGMNAPKVLATFAGGGHLLFSDICLIGKDQGGLVSLVRQTGLQIPPDLLRLASDGCQPEALDPTDAFPAIDHLSVSFLRWTLGIDEEPVGLDPSVADAFPKANLTVESDLTS